MLVNVMSRGEWGIPHSALEGTQHGEEGGTGAGGRVALAWSGSPP